MNSIVIVGGGIAGLQAAQILQSKGLDFILIEKTSSLGGRVQSEQFQGFTLDHGFQVLQTAYPEVQRSIKLSKWDLSYFQSGAYVLQNGKFKPFLNPLKSPFLFLKNVNSSGANIFDFLKLAWIWFKTQGSISPTNSNIENTSELILRYHFSDKFQRNFLRPFFAGIFLDDQLSPPASLFFYYMKQFLEGKAAIPKQGMGAIALDLASRIPKEKLKTSAWVTEIKDKSLILNNGEIVYFDQLILATDPKHACELLKIDFPPEAHFGSKTFYFSMNKNLATSLPLIYLMPLNSSPVLHFSCLSQVNPSLAPEGKHLISATSLQMNLTDLEVVQELARVLGLSTTDFIFLKSFSIPHSLFKVGYFNDVCQKAKGENIILAGDYTHFPSLQAALSSGRNAAEKITTSSQTD
jgi:phytoene dehydrogenase-like protein